MSRWLRRHTRSVNAWALEQLALGADDRLLEIGFGSGDLLLEALSRNGRLEAAGLDRSGEMVRAARRRLDAFLPEGRLELVEGDVASMPFGDGRFSRVITVNTLYFWPSPASALAECRRVLADGGELLLCFDAKEDLARWPGHRFGFRLYEPWEVEVLVREAGFEVLDVRSRTFPGYGVAHALRARSALEL